ncbi:MAG: enoyl-CoA hydratase/isomerase family protein [Pseudomonadota bacterium]
MTASDEVLIQELPTAGKALLGHAHLNVEATLNALSLSMARVLDAALRDWQKRDDIAGVVITAAGDKAFCAGGDIQALYRAITANHAAAEVVDTYPFDFFAEEYRLDYLLHTYGKPVITLGHGIVMGGGLGILCASEYRLLTEKSRLAVPEITIGLFPDAGATWTLGKMEPRHALFLALTGSHANATDSLLTGMGHHVVAHDQRDACLQQLVALAWSGDGAVDRSQLDELLASLTERGLAPAVMPESELGPIAPGVIDFTNLQAEAEGIYALEGQSPWIDRGINNLRNGCPTTAGIVLEQLRRVPDMTLADAFRMELTVATHCAFNHDFSEGVRALLIDKDNQPQWAYGDIAHLDWQHVLNHFAPPWPEHPLADLGA